MRSFQIAKPGAALQMTEQPTPEPKGSEVLLRVIAAGVCHSDLHLSDGYFDLGGGKRLSLTERGMKLPLTLGHENVGEVAAFGPEAKGVRIGDRRLVDPWMGCGECRVCRRGDEQLCTKPSSIGVFRNGGYSDFLLVPHPRYLFDIGDLPPARAAPLACSGITTFSALKKVGPTLTTDPVVVIGAGGLGLMCIALHRTMGGHSTIVVDVDPIKREAAKQAGASHAIDGTASDAAQQIVQATDGGSWATIDLVGSAATARLGIDSLVKGGKLIVVGLYGGEIVQPVPPFPMRAITLQGSYTGSLTEMAEILALVREKGLPPIPVATRPLDEVNMALDDLRAGKVVGRVVLTPS